MRMSYKADIAINILNEGLENNKDHSFAQADMLVRLQLDYLLVGSHRYYSLSSNWHGHYSVRCATRRLLMRS